MSKTNHPEQPESRLDREISEILQEARKRPISFQDRVTQKRSMLETQKQSTASKVRAASAGPLRSAGRAVIRIPLVSALVIALIAVWLAPDYSLAASLLALVAAALIFVPFVLTKPSDRVSYQKKWRGRPINASRPPDSGGMGGTIRSWVDSNRDRRGR